MEDLLKLERQVQEIYDTVLHPLGEKIAYPLPKGWKGATGLPSVLLLGNHSSGKSSFINYLVGAEVQKSGLAPTDDGFTILTFGEKPDEFDGQTVVTHRDLAYRDLQRLGPAFLSRLRLKTHRHDLLRSVTLIDSPGMIDAAGKGNTRGYDFAASVRFFAEQADLILFFFDPDKPGTTGETVSIFTETLAGLEYKLLIILNKVDLFQNIRDFARTYGTLCWNLSKNIRTKDIPHIFNIYVPGKNRTPPPENNIPLADFDVSREEVVQEIRRTPTRRADNLVSDLYQNTRKLGMHAGVFQSASRAFRRTRLKWSSFVALELALTGLAVWLFWDPSAWRTPGLILLGGIALAVGLGYFAKFQMRRFKQRMVSESFLNNLFDQYYQRQLALQDRADLRALWESLRHRVAVSLELVGPQGVSPSSLKKPLRRTDEILEVDVPGLRREIAIHHPPAPEESKMPASVATTPS